MSIQAMSWVIEHSPHKGAELLCLIMIANHAHADGTGAYPSVTTLANECRMSPRQITRLIQRLEAAGSIIVERGKGPRGTHLMTVVMDENAPKVTTTTLTPDKMSPDKMSGGDKMSPDKMATGGDIAMSPEPSLEPSIKRRPAGDAAKAAPCKTATKKTAQAKATPVTDLPAHREWFEVVRRAVQADPNAMPATLRSQIGKAAKELRQSGADLADADAVIRLFHKDMSYKVHVRPAEFVTFWPQAITRIRSPHRRSGEADWRRAIKAHYGTTDGGTL